MAVIERKEEEEEEEVKVVPSVNSTVEDKAEKALIKKLTRTMGILGSLAR